MGFEKLKVHRVYVLENHNCRFLGWMLVLTASVQEVCSDSTLGYTLCCENNLWSKRPLMSAPLTLNISLMSRSAQVNAHSPVPTYYELAEV